MIRSRLRGQCRVKTLLLTLEMAKYEPTFPEYGLKSTEMSPPVLEMVYWNQPATYDCRKRLFLTKLQPNV